MTGTSSDSSPEIGVSVWLSRAPAEPDWDELRRCLNDSEQSWMEALGPNRQLEYSHSRWLLRQALAGVSGIPAHLCHPVAGRPLQSAEPPGWALSLSHSHGIAACALARADAVGVDIEPRARQASWRRVVSRWFDPLEQDWLLAANSREDFLRVWTLKEAWLKATGRGIADNLRTLRVAADGSLTGDQPGRQWRACTGETGDLTLAVVHNHGPGPLAAPRVHWLASPDLQENEPAGEGQARVEWWTCTEIAQGNRP